MPHKNGLWRHTRSRRSSFSSQALAKELHELLEIPMTVLYSSGGFRYEKPKKGTLIIQAIVKSLVSALQRGESVSINGFGRFTVETQKVRSGGTLRAAASNGDIIGSPKISVLMAPKKRIIFYPSAHLTALLNQESPYVPNYTQKKAMLNWGPINED